MPRPASKKTAVKTPAVKPVETTQDEAPKEIPIVPGMQVRNGMTREQIEAEYKRVTGE